MKNLTSNVCLQVTIMQGPNWSQCHHLIYCVRLYSLGRNIYLPGTQKPVLEFRPYTQFHPGKSTFKFFNLLKLIQNFEMLPSPQTFNKTCQMKIYLLCISFSSSAGLHFTSVTFASVNDFAAAVATPFTLMVLLLASPSISVGSKRTEQTL